ncbi:MULTISPECIES: DUF2867 domain-containing protein [unclassified Chryseobacterium]|uniref:DUF2867 domain-containing protein n=1 Tax=unclassified Chryseobacterium TaxID=2593645 RepID=UPI00100A8117|nr:MULTISPECIES: DUF2867 domain-containing protein [unclassified Chryseobacterium]RXM50469.1 hypothetical protein BOQ64_18815 [Chryseobacterium sp. CH25]RXM64610.1 hypothetical protein BOQ60_10310 [Chryseobacterium sp. CH1]
MKIKKIEFPTTSILFQGKEKFDYADSFVGGLVGNGQNFDIAQIGKAFFTCGPTWGKKMFAFRNKVVKWFGLKTGAETDPVKEAESFTGEVGEHIGIFKVFNKTNNEIILGEDDKHLDFRVSLLFDKNQGGQDENSLTISTTVKFHNWLGVLYFLPVRPFHQLIVPAMLKNIIGKLENAK